MKADNKDIIREAFNSKDKNWRIEAVIHDGNWYDFDKWRRVAKVEKEDLLNWIKDNEDILNKSEQGSYRVEYDDIIKWYEKEEIDIEDNIVPNNFPPKLWDNTTETDVFLNSPRRRVGTVNFIIESQEILDKCIDILRGTAKIMPDANNRYRAYGLSPVHMRNLLSRGLTEVEYNSLNLKTRAVLLQRELIDLPDKWLEEALSFYADIFAPSILKSALSTISIYLPDRNDRQSQTLIWVITAMKKFDENASVPFSGYLSSVLRHWPYNLPDEHLGRELSLFQRDRKRAIDEVVGKEQIEHVPIEQLAEIMDIPVSDYVILNNEHENWLAERNATSLVWEDSANEKKGVMVGLDNSESNIKEGVEEKARISISIIKAAVDTEDWESAFAVISQVDTTDINEDLNSKLAPDFISKFAEYLGSYIKEEI